MQVETGAPKNRIARIFDLPDPDPTVVYEQCGRDSRPGIHLYFRHPERYYFDPVVPEEWARVIGS